MTVAAKPAVKEYIEDGVTLAFAAPFRFLNATDLEVSRIEGGGKSILAYGTQWSASGGSTDDGGTVTLVSTAAGATLRIRRVTARGQTADYETNDTFPAESHEQALDRAMLINQEQDDDISDLTGRGFLALPGQEGLAFDRSDLTEGDILQYTGGQLQRLNHASFAGKFFAGDAVGHMVPSAGTGGADTALRLDLASLLAGASLVAFAAAGAGAEPRTALDKLRERVSILDYGAVDGGDIGDAVDAALAALGDVDPARLIFPRGSYTLGANVDWSAYRNVTFALEGVTINHGAFNIVFPERVDASLGVKFIGAGMVTQKNKDETVLVAEPGGYVRVGNQAMGLRALAANIGGHNNLAWGVDALGKAQHVRSAIAIGNQAQAKVVGDPTGARALVGGGPEILGYFAAGDAGVAIGDVTLRDNLTGTECVAIGANSLQQQIAGHCNVAVGGNSQITNLGGSFNNSLGWVVSQFEIQGRTQPK